MTKTPTLYRLAADRQYDRIPDRIRCNPDDLFWTDRYGSTALHILCQARVVDKWLLQAVDAIVRHAPALVSWPNVASWTPLHFAVEKRLVCGPTHASVTTSSAAATYNHHNSSNHRHDHSGSSSNYHSTASTTSSISAGGENNNSSAAAAAAAEEYYYYHYYNAHTALILRLLRACPQAVSIRTQGVSKSKTPFHIACEADAEYSVLEAMLCIQPSLATEPWVKKDVYSISAENPLSVLWKHYYYYRSSSSSSSTASITTNGGANHSHNSSSNGNGYSSSGSSNHRTCRTKQKMALLLQAAYCKCIVNPTTYNHRLVLRNQRRTRRAAAAAAGAGVEPNNHNNNNDNQLLTNNNKQTSAATITSLTTAASSDTIATGTSSDDHDDFFQDPACRSFRLLNAACSVRCPRDYFTQVLQESSQDDIHQPDEDGYLPIHYAVLNAHADSQNYTQFVIESLLHVSPNMASVPSRRGGRLPLHMAVSDAHSLTWHKGGVDRLVRSHPTALYLQDPTSGLVPFLASATAATQSRLHLSTTYELLLAAPELVHAGKWRKNNTTTTTTTTTLTAGSNTSDASKSATITA